MNTSIQQLIYLLLEVNHFLGIARVHLLSQSLRFDEDVEVGLLQLLSYHCEDSRCRTELSQVVNDELKEQLKEKAL